MLKTVKNSKNLYENTGGELKPFFWLGDTAWLLLQKLNMSEIEAYFRSGILTWFSRFWFTMITWIGAEKFLWI